MNHGLRTTDDFLTNPTSVPSHEDRRLNWSIRTGLTKAGIGISLHKMREHEFQFGLYREAKVNKHISRARLVRVVLASALLVPLLLWVSGCWLFNVPPTAGFSINEQAGQAPFAVNFSAGVLSTDEDGIIIQYEWDFGDGSSGSGKNVTHTYATAGTFTAVLVVTDNDGDTATNRKHIYVSPAPPPGPAASFTASPTSGTSPLTVFADASASSYPAGVISQYRWNWGDGSTGYGKTASHTYFSTGARTYTLTLTLYATDGKIGTATRTISVTVAGGTTPAAGAPSARFSINFDDITEDPVVEYANNDVAPVHVWLDPEDSEAVEGRTIASYTWTFGDGSSTHTINSAPVSHVYRTDQSSEVFSITLVLIDDVGTVGSITKTVKVYNYQPTAGFQIYDTLGLNALIVDETLIAAQAFHAGGGTWKSTDVTYNSVQTPSTTVWIRSLPPTLPTWVGDPTPANDVDTQGTSSTEPTNFDTADSEDNLCFDPEGQGWDEDATAPYLKTVKPTGWASVSWGIERIEINWGDNTTQNYDYYTWVMNGTANAGMFMHTYAPPGITTAQYTITVTAHDFLGAQASFSRKVTLKSGN